MCGKRGADVRPDFNWSKTPGPEGAAAFICTALIAFGILITVLSHGFFMNLLGAGTAAAGGAAAYLIFAEGRAIKIENPSTFGGAASSACGTASAE